MDTMEVIRANIRNLLKEKKWTQAYLAERMGVQSNYISDILVGKRGDKMKIPFAESIAEAFDITIIELLTPLSDQKKLNNKSYKDIIEWIQSLYIAEDDRKKSWFEVEFEKKFSDYCEWLEKRENKKSKNTQVV